MNGHQMRASVCRRCRSKLDAATGMTDDAMPDEGSVSICWYCGTLAVYAADLSLRAPSIIEVSEMLDDPQIGRLLDHIWSDRGARVVAAVDGVEFACGCKTTAGAGLFTLEACAEACGAAQMIMRMLRDSGTPMSVIR